MEKVIEIENLTKCYGKFKAIDNLSLYVEKGKNIWLTWTKWKWKIYNNKIVYYHYWNLRKVQ